METETTPSEELPQSLDSEVIENPSEGTAPKEGEGESKPEGSQDKTFTQEELNSVVGKRLQIERRRWEREQSKKSAEQQVKLQSDSELPQFNSKEEFDAYVADMVKRRDEQLREIEQKNSIAERKEQMIEKAVEKYDDFTQLIANPKLWVTDDMFSAMIESDVASDIAYYLATNVQESEQIAKMSAHGQAKEIGKIEAKLLKDPNMLLKSVSKTPEPVNPGGSKNDGVKVYETTDPRSTKTMSTEEWIKAEEQRMIRKMQAGRG